MLWLGVTIAYGKEEVRDVVRDVHRHAHVREVEAVAQPYEPERDDVVQHQLPEILPRLLELQELYQPLLCPVRCL